MHKTIDLLKKLENYPVFSNKIVSNITKKDESYTRLLIHRLKRKRLVYKIARDIYTLHKEPLVIASNIVWPCYLSLWTALRYNNLTEQLPQAIFVITTRQKRGMLKIGNTRITFSVIKPSYFFGYKKERHGGFDIFIARPEKSIIDAILLRKISASEIAEIIRSHIAEIDDKLLVKYLLRLKSKSVAKRLGYILDTAGKGHYEKLKPLIDYKYIPVDFSLPGKGRKNRKWKVIENVST